MQHRGQDKPRSLHRFRLDTRRSRHISVSNSKLLVAVQSEMIYLASMWWVGYLETVEPPVLPWFFHRDYAVVVACAVRYIFGAQNNLESPNSPDMSSPSQAYLELRSTPSSTSSSSSTAPTPSDTPSSPPYETVAPPDQAQPGPNTTDPIKSSQDERHTDGTAEETSPRADPAALEDSGPPQEQPLTNATPDDPRPQPYNDPPPLIVGRPEGDAAGNGPNSSCSPASSTNTAPLDSGLELEFGPSATIASGRVDNTGIRADTEPESLSWPATFPSPSEIFTSPTSDSTGQPQAEGTTSFALESSLESDVEVTGESFTAPGTSTPGDQTYVNLSSRGEIFSSAVERREGGTLRRRAGTFIAMVETSETIGTNEAFAHHHLLASLLPWISYFRRTDGWCVSSATITRADSRLVLRQ